MRPLTIVSVAVLAAIALSACEPPVPANPSYATDVRPIFLAHCVRCHGAGGTLQFGPDAGTRKPLQCYLDIYDDVGDCTSDPTNCKRGALFCAAYIPSIFATMPPAPATINSWEREVLTRWAAIKPPAP